MTTQEPITPIIDEAQVDASTPDQVVDQQPAEPPRKAKARKGKGRVRTLPRKRIVKALSVGMEVSGTIKRTSDFGAFVDIGVGRDGLLHISELSTRRVHNVTDVVKEGDEITVWIKELDREKNRISLTMISPDTQTIRDLSEGQLVTGTVQRLTNYGAFVDIGLDRDALLHVKEMAEGFVARPEDVVKIGEEIEARIVGVDRRRGRIDLSLKGLRPEQGDGGDVQIDPLTFDEEDEEVPSQMELALREALGNELPTDSRDRRSRKGKAKGKSRRRERFESQEDILNRTMRYNKNRG